jgi:hypothetical protein
MGGKITGSKWRLEERLTDTRDGRKNENVVSGFVYDDEVSALADAEIFRWLKGRMSPHLGPEKPQRTVFDWRSTGPRECPAMAAAVLRVGNYASENFDVVESSIAVLTSTTNESGTTGIQTIPASAAVPPVLDTTPLMCQICSNSGDSRHGQESVLGSVGVSVGSSVDSRHVQESVLFGQIRHHGEKLFQIPIGTTLQGEYTTLRKP